METGCWALVVGGRGGSELPTSQIWALGNGDGAAAFPDSDVLKEMDSELLLQESFAPKSPLPRKLTHSLSS